MASGPPWATLSLPKGRALQGRPAGRPYGLRGALTTARMAAGTLKWFGDEKGLGSIEQEGGGEDVFVHFNSTTGSGDRTLPEGAKVEFEVRSTPKGLRAENVVVAEDSPSSVAW